MKNNAVKIIIIFAMTAGVVLLSGCQSRFDTSGSQNTSYIGSEESSVQITYSVPGSEKSESTVQSAPDSAEPHTVSENSVSGNDQETSRIDTEQSIVSNMQITSEQTISGSKPMASGTDPMESTEENIMETNELYIKIGGNTLNAVLEDNESAAALKKLLINKTLTISASNYGGFEKVCSLGTSLPRNDVQTTARAGDICLYSGNQIVIFYGSNSWSYTRLGKISNANGSELKKILSGTETELTLSLKPFD